MGFRLQFLQGKLPENLAYGHHAILARYCSLNTSKLKIFARYQHGFGYSEEFPDDRILSLVWSNYVAEAAKNIGLTKFRVIGAPIVYYMDTHNPETRKQEPKKKFSLCIAPHSLFNDPKNIFESDDFKKYFPSISFSSATRRIEYFARKCREESNFRPVVLLYYKDYSPFVIEYFNKMGIRAVTLGDGIFDPNNQEDYFDRTIKIISMAEEVLVCDTNTLWVYAGYLGKNIRVLRETVFESNIEKVQTFFGDSAQTEPSFFHRALGASHKKSPSELLEIFGSASMKSIFKNRLRFLEESVENGANRLIYINRRKAG